MQEYIYHLKEDCAWHLDSNRFWALLAGRWSEYAEYHKVGFGFTLRTV